MNRARRIILPIVMAVVLTLITCIPIFAYNTIQEELRVPPSDLGEIYNYSQYQGSGYAKFYLKIDTQTYTGANAYYFIDQYAYANQNYIGITLSNNELKLEQYMSTSNTLLLMPRITFTVQDRYYYIPVYCYQCYPNLSGANNWNGIDIYISSTTDQDVLLHEAFQQGYENGYTDGFIAGEYAEQYTNITGYVTELLSKFVGSEYAEYLTPISIVLVILMVYFLFIRFLLSMIKAKGVMKTCDIIMITACIILLVVMYAPKLNLTIKTEQITTETTSTLNRNVEEVKTKEYETIHTETGDIWVGPAGTILFPDVETTDSGQRATESVDVSTSTEGERE